jgi:hypothetical protein
VGRSWLFPSSSITHQKEPEDKRIQLLSIVRSRRFKNSVLGQLKVRQLME